MAGLALATVSHAGALGLAWVSSGDCLGLLAPLRAACCDCLKLLAALGAACCDCLKLLGATRGGPGRSFFLKILRRAKSICFPILALYQNNDFPRPLSLLVMLGLALATVSHAGALGRQILDWLMVCGALSAAWPTIFAIVSDSGRPARRPRRSQV